MTRTLSIFLCIVFFLIGAGVQQLFEIYGTSPQIKMVDTSASVSDYSMFQSDANGALSISTNDNDGTAGNINIAPDGYVSINVNDPKLILGGESPKSWFTASYDVGVIQIGQAIFAGRDDAVAGGWVSIGHNAFLNADGDWARQIEDEYAILQAYNGDFHFYVGDARPANNIVGLNEVLSVEGSETVVNNGSIVYDFRVESNAYTHMLFVDGGDNCVGIGMDCVAGHEVDVTGDIYATGRIVSGALSELTIATGIVTATSNAHKIDTEGDTASDDLDTILGGTAGMVLIITPANGARTVVVKHNTGNILVDALGSDISLSDEFDNLTLIYDGAYWVQTAYTDY